MLKSIAGMLAGAILFSAISSQSAWSQNAPQSTEAQSGGLEEVVVTAQKRPENLQVVPVSITALSGTMLDNRNVTTVQGFAEFVPN